MAIIYFSKINLNDDQIFDEYEGKDVLKNIQANILSNIDGEYEYNKIESFDFIDSNNEKKIIEYTGTYKFIDISIKNDIVEGFLKKTAPLYSKKIDETTRAKTYKYLENDEVINFCYDVKKEIVMFFTVNRFGYKDFNQAFGGLLSRVISSKRENSFSVDLILENINIEKVKEDLKHIGPISELSITMIPPNPSWRGLSEEIRKDAETKITEMKNANVTNIEYTVKSNSEKGIKIDSELINKNLNEIIGIHSKLSEENALENGYVKIEAISNQGVYSNEEKSHKKMSIPEYIKDSRERFVEWCLDVLNTL